MSCDAVASLAVLWLAATGPMTPGPGLSTPPAAVAQEPLFADIVKRAGALKADVDGVRAGKALPADFKAQIGELAALDMQGHLLLAKRGTDGDLKCILRGISQDLPLKLDAVTTAATPKDRDLALRDMAYLLNDNVEVITTPATVTSQSAT
ncbi:MAG: hypothetical protein KA085_11365 [Phenylobacterium sp.]|uniref:hypothetical protein n=1 Tax=Phenylobacterium sp. TaxID=1871053 RepID=UPI001B526F9E|nr:hypothetical protein [Phenylobacterium sp.]MBP7650213.1 hypothetical protein [Phenylobacterium sp.]MBP7816717.1 hypothetical protein [Phenylobacterium sp.]MBP9753864.1 hypothetical protein [Phenylobacterium sp.]